MGEEPTLGHFALVSYISDPLATFLDGLSMELAPEGKPHAHVTVLPPRPHRHDLKETISLIIAGMKQFQPFRVEIGEIEIFPFSHVIYLGLRDGSEPLRRLYTALNCDCLQFREAFPYHPHVTVARVLEREESATTAAVARERWLKYKGPRGFDVAALSLVQHVAPSVWVDVATLNL